MDDGLHILFSFIWTIWKWKEKGQNKINFLERRFESQIFGYNSHPQFDLSQKVRVTGSNSDNLLKELGLYLVLSLRNSHLSNLKWISSQTPFVVAFGIFFKDLRFWVSMKWYRRNVRNQRINLRKIDKSTDFSQYIKGFIKISFSFSLFFC